MIDPSLIDVVLPEHDGYPEELAKEDTRENLCAAAEEAGAVVTDFPNSLWIEPREWADRCDYNTENKLWGMDFLDRFTNQQPTHECTCHSLRACFEGARNRQRAMSFGGPIAGKRLAKSARTGSVWVSPLSIYIEANPAQWGGANVRQVLYIAAKRGFLPEPIQPKDYGFKHTLHGTTGKGGINQATGPWVRLRDLPEDHEETSQHFKPLEFIFPETIEQHICLLIHGFLVGVGRDGHAVPHGKFLHKEKLFPYTDSYDVVRYDSYNTARRTVGGSFAIISTTTPDDWNNPAGN